ncbi:MAG: hypothetical protein LBS00_12710, partial [Synergistaceae bacterium]|nr:hypothetical protein [Synergistaceae bacterium]
MRKRALSVCLMVFCLCFLGIHPERAQAKTVLDVVVTSPWLSLLTTFIGGVNVKVTSIQEWNEDGELVRRIRTRSLR